VFAPGAALNNLGTTIFNGDTLAGIMTNSGNATFNAGGTIGGVYTNTGTTTLNGTTVAGTYTNNGTTNLNGVETLASGATFNENGTVSFTIDSTLNNNGVFNWNSGSIDGAAAFSVNPGGSLVMTASGNRTLNGPSLSDLAESVTTLGAGTLTINGGTLSANNLTVATGATLALPTTGGALNVLLSTNGASGVVNLNGTLSIGTPPPAGTTATGGGTVTTNTINVNGTGATLIANGGDGSIDAVAVNLLNGGTLMGSGSVGVSSSAFGALAVNNAGGFVAPGNSPGILTIDGTYAQASTGTLVVQIQGNTPGSYDQLIVRDGASLNGALQVNVLPGYQPAVGQTFQVVALGSTGTSTTGTAGGISGSFASTSISQAGITFVNNYQPTFFNLDLTAYVPPTVPQALQVSTGAFLVALDMVAQPGEPGTSSNSDSANSKANDAASQDLATQLLAALPGCIQ
jgi:hypothetical protein